MAAAPNTGSLTEGLNGRNRTGTSLSTNIIIETDTGMTIGAIQSISINENRRVTMVSEVGTDGHIDSAPTSSTDYDGTCRRIRYDSMRISEAFSRGFIHAKSQRIPFNIVIKDIHSGDEAKAVVTTIKNVWITKIGYTYNHDNFIIMDDMSWVAEDVYSTLGTSNTNVATGGDRGIILDLNSIERAADRGERRGSLDASGLLNAFFDISFGGTP